MLRKKILFFNVESGLDKQQQQAHVIANGANTNSDDTVALSLSLPYGAGDDLRAYTDNAIDGIDKDATYVYSELVGVK